MRNFGFSSESQIWGFEAHFLYQEKAECYFYNGTQQVRFLARWFYDRQEFVRFDSDLGKFVAVTEWMRTLNRDEQILQYNKACVDSFCRHNYEVYNYEAAKREERLIGRRSESWGGALLPWEGEAGTPLSFPGLHWGFSSRVTVQPPSSFCLSELRNLPLLPRIPTLL
ncbi:putative MHC class II antigen protein, partial [Naja naja]